MQNWKQNKPEILWRIPAGDDFSGISISSGKLFTMWDEGDSQFLLCLDVKSGKKKWKARGYRRGPLIVADDHLIVLGGRGKLALVEATPSDYREIASAKILNSDQCWTSYWADA